MPRFDLPQYETADTTVARWIVERGLGAGFAVINTGAGWPSKLWPAERYAEVAQHLGRQWNLPSVVAWAGETEQRVAHEISIRAGGFANIAPATSLTELAQLARRARLFIGSDTGPLHIAAAVGTPCVGLYGPMPASRCRPYGRQHIAVQNILPPGKIKNRRVSNASMLAIGEVEVCEACDTILNRGSARRKTAVPKPHFARRVKVA
jgi:heptosyltransferase I